MGDYDEEFGDQKAAILLYCRMGNTEDCELYINFSLLEVEK